MTDGMTGHIECDGGPYCQATEHVHGCFAEHPPMLSAAGKLEAENERLREALAGIKARCDRIVAGEHGGLDAALEISNEARRALRGAVASDEQGGDGA